MSCHTDDTPRRTERTMSYHEWLVYCMTHWYYMIGYMG
jgi:hypothetical protein